MLWEIEFVGKLETTCTAHNVFESRKFEGKPRVKAIPGFRKPRILKSSRIVVRARKMFVSRRRWSSEASRPWNLDTSEDTSSASKRVLVYLSLSMFGY